MELLLLQKTYKLISIFLFWIFLIKVPPFPSMFSFLQVSFDFINTLLLSPTLALQDDRHFSILRKSLGSFFESGSDDDFEHED